MTYAKPRDLYDVIVTCISQSVHCMTSCSPARQQLRYVPYDFTEHGVRRWGEGGLEPYDDHQLKLDIFGQKYPKKAWLIADINIFFFQRNFGV